MAVRIGMHSRGLAQLSLLSALYWLDGTSGALAQLPDAGTAPAQPSAPAAPPASAPPAAGAVPSAQPGAQGAAQPSTPPPAPPAVDQPAPAPPGAAPGFSPQPSPLVPPPPPGQYVYPQQAPVYPQPYVAEPPGYYGNAPPPSSYPYAQPYPERGTEPVDEGYRRHDGFFLRLKIGIGAGGARYEERINGMEEADIRTRGLAGSFELAIGGSIIENLALHGNLLLTGLSVNKKVDDVADNSYDRLSMGMLLLGGGATYYFMPTNLYLTAVTGVGALSESRYLDDDDDTAFTEIESGAGFGVSLSLGKEWWVGRMGEWGLGAAITGTIVTAPVRIGELSTRFLGHSIALNFSATFN